MTYPYYPQYPQYQLQQMPQQTFSLPTIHADIIQVDNEQQAENFGVAVGSTQMMIAKDESCIFAKTALNNGQHDFRVYRKEERKQAEKPDYITRSEVEEMLKKIQTKSKEYKDDELI